MIKDEKQLSELVWQELLESTESAWYSHSVMVSKWDVEFACSEVFKKLLQDDKEKE